MLHGCMRRNWANRHDCPAIAGRRTCEFRRKGKFAGRGRQTMSTTILYDYWRSSASYRVRIALNAAGVEHVSVPVDLLSQQHRLPEHLARNPQGSVPVLDIDGIRLTQSLAIIEYLDETREAGFLPDTPAGRARVRAIAHAVAMEIHPVCNPSVVAEVLRLASGDEAMRVDWMKHFIRKGLIAVEKLLDHPATGRFCHGSVAGLADFCLIPQLYNARRWGAEISDLETVLRIEAACLELPAFRAAVPEAVQPPA